MTAAPSDTFAARRPAIALLKTYAPEVLAGLRAHLPQHNAALSTEGMVLGDEVLRVDAVSCVAALNVGTRLCETAATSASRQLGRAKVANLVGSVFTAVAGAAIFTVAAADAPRTAAYAAGVFAVVGSISSILASFFAQGRGGDVQSSFKELAGYSFRLIRVQSGLSSRLQLREWDEALKKDVRELVMTGQELCEKVQQAAAVVGLSALIAGEQAAMASTLPTEADLFLRKSQPAITGLIPSDPNSDKLPV